MKQIRTVLIKSVLIIGLISNYGCTKDEFEPSSNLSPGAVSSADLTGEKPVITLRSNRYIIISATNSLPAGIESQVSAANGKVTSLMKEVGIATAYSTDPNFAKKAAGITGVRSVINDVSAQWIKPDQQKQVKATFGTPPFSGDDDFLYDLQWGHDAINVPEAWNAGYRGRGARVAVLDTGFDLTHPDLASNIDLAASKSFVPGEELQFMLPDFYFSHGTHTAGIVAAADNGIGVIGVAPEAQLILIKVLPDQGNGDFSWLLNGIIHAVNQGSDVINMSLGAEFPRNGKFLNDNGTPGDPSDDFVVSATKAIQELIVAINKVTTYAHQKGVTVIASAGNSSSNGNKDRSLVSMPADAPHVISISSTAPIGWALNLNSNLDHLASYSNYGTPEIDLAAPGGDYSYPGNELATIGFVTAPVWVFDMVISTLNGNSWGWLAGTSMAAPHAAGVAALIIGKNGGQMDPAKVETVLRVSADDLGKPGRDPYYGHGRVNAYKAVATGL